MPIYEYVCLKCKRNFEELVLGKSDRITCPTCKSKEVTREMSMFAYSCNGTFRSTKASSCDSCKKSSCDGCSKS